MSERVAFATLSADAVGFCGVDYGVFFPGLDYISQWTPRASVGGSFVPSFPGFGGWVPSGTQGCRWALVEIAGALGARTVPSRRSVLQVGSGLRSGL